MFPEIDSLQVGDTNCIATYIPAPIVLKVVIRQSGRIYGRRCIALCIACRFTATFRNKK